MASKTATASKQQPLTVPQRFGIVEQGVYRSNTPLPSQIPFLKTLALKTIISLTPEASHPTLSAYYSQYGIEMIPLGMTLWQPYQMRDHRPISDQLVKETIEMVLDKTKGPVLIIDPSGIHLTGIVVGCLRKMQHWNFAAILVEYRSFAGPTKHRYSDEQYIEMFDTDLINIPQEPAAWYADGEQMWREEEEEAEAEAEAAARDASRAGGPGTDEAKEDKAGEDDEERQWKEKGEEGEEEGKKGA